MYLTIKLFLKVNQDVEEVLLAYEKSFKEEIERVADIFAEKGGTYEYRVKNLSKAISYDSKYLVVQEAKRIYQLKMSGKRVQYDYSSYWMNRSYQIMEGCLRIELGPNKGKKHLLIPFYPNKQPMLRISSGRITNMKLIKRKKYWYATILVEYLIDSTQKKEVMGIDLGVKVPAVVATSNSQIRFFGNGREIRFEQRKFRAHIKAMQRNKQISKLNRFEHKLSHVLNNYDHEISREIIDFAVANDIGLIKMERLTSINKRFNVKNCADIYLWSYRRIQEYIAYKAELAGIRIQYVNPYRTSQICPRCGQVNKARDRDYRCSCGYHNHRDVVAAINIMNAL